MMKIVTGAFDTVRPFLPWIAAGAAVAAVVVIAVLLIVRAVLRRKHDQALEAEARAEQEQEAPSALEAEVTVIPEEDLPHDDGHIFMPVPAALSDMVDFIQEKRDGVSVRSFVRAEDADALLTDEQAQALCAVIHRIAPDEEARDDMAYVSVDTLSANFAPYSYINLAILKKHGFVEAHITALSIRGEGTLRKPLMVEADEFSLSAVKMLSLVGGRAVEMRHG